MVPVPTDAERVRELTRITTVLTDKVDGLHASSERQNKIIGEQNKLIAAYNEKQDRKHRWTRVVVALDLVATLGFGWLFYRDTVLRQHVLCPLYKIFADSYNPTSLAAKAQGIDAYNATFADILTQFVVLDCSGVDYTKVPKMITPK